MAVVLIQECLVMIAGAMAAAIVGGSCVRCVCACVDYIKFSTISLVVSHSYPKKNRN
jgi:hypothetical protein